MDRRVHFSPDLSLFLFEFDSAGGPGADLDLNFLRIRPNRFGYHTRVGAMFVDIHPSPVTPKPSSDNGGYDNLRHKDHQIQLYPLDRSVTEKANRRGEQ